MIGVPAQFTMEDNGEFGFVIIRERFEGPAVKTPVQDLGYHALHFGFVERGEFAQATCNLELNLVVFYQGSLEVLGRRKQLMDERCVHKAIRI